MNRQQTYIFALLVIAVAVALTAAAGRVIAGSEQDREGAFGEVREAFDSGDWSRVLVLVDRFRRGFPHSKRESSVTFLAAQAALRDRHLARALWEAQRLWVLFPRSVYRDDARMIMAECAILAERWEAAQRELNWVIAFSPDDSLVLAARERSNELRMLFARREALERRAEAEVDTGLTGTTPVALLLPLSGGLAAEAGAFLEGFLARWRGFGLPEPQVFDTGGDPVRAVRLARSLARERRVWATIGGLEPSEAAGLATAAQLDRMPFLTTVCGSEGVASIGGYAFQGRPDHSLIGRRLAQFAVGELGLGRFGILAPNSTSGRQLTEGFKRVVRDHGCEILDEEVYYPGTEDFRVYFNRLRRIGLRFAFADSVRLYFNNHGALIIDSARVEPPARFLVVDTSQSFVEDSTIADTTWMLADEYIDSLWEAEHQRLRRWMETTGEEMDSLEIPVDAYEGFLLLVEPGHQEMLAPQFARANLRTRVLGGEEWSDRRALKRILGYVEGMVFADPLAPVGGDEYDRFIEQVGGMPDDPLHRSALGGARAATMVEFALRRAHDPESMRIALSQIRDLPTLSGKVSLLKEERVDRFVPLVQVIDGSIKPLEE